MGLRLTIHRGTRQIGGVCIEIKHPDGDRIVLDAGRPRHPSRLYSRRRVCAVQALRLFTIPRPASELSTLRCSWLLLLHHSVAKHECAGEPILIVVSSPGLMVTGSSVFQTASLKPARPVTITTYFPGRGTAILKWPSSSACSEMSCQLFSCALAISHLSVAERAEL